MKSKLIVATLVVAVFVVVTSAIVPAEAARVTDQDDRLSQMKADQKRVKKLIHGYIKYNGNKVYYYW